MGILKRFRLWNSIHESIWWLVDKTSHISGSFEELKTLRPGEKRSPENALFIFYKNVFSAACSRKSLREYYEKFKSYRFFLVFKFCWKYQIFSKFQKVHQISGNQELVSLFPDDYEDYQDNRSMGRDNLLARTSYTYLQQDLNLSTDHFRKIVFTDFSECIVINEDEAVIIQENTREL